jgi:hypothetical protein
MFTSNDTYTTGIDYTSPTLILSSLPLGIYSINIGPVQGCDYRNFTFIVGPCAPLNIFLKSFNGNQSGNETRIFAELSGCQELSSLLLEVSKDGIHFEQLASIPYGEADNQSLSYTVKDAPGKYFRLNMINQKMVSKLSPVLVLANNSKLNSIQLAPNPFKNSFQLSIQTAVKEKLRIEIRNAAGSLLQQRQFDAVNGMNLVQIPVENLAKGIYFIRVIHSQTGESQVFKGIKE